MQQSRLWREALAERAADEHSEKRSRLRVALQGFRQRAAQLASEIPRHLANYTVHDVTHLDALWGLCDVIAGPEIHLTPPEAFVLGGAILCHDLGMSASAYVGGLTDIEASPMFSEAITVLGLDGDRLNSEQRDQAIAWVLRENHAVQGGRLPTQGWRNSISGESLYLIEDADLRRAYGVLIGQIAASHWWNYEKVTAQFARYLGAALDFPPYWSVDILKLASLVRLADAAHIDARRAPTFLRVIRGIQGPSELHWLFQECITQPRLLVDRLEYTSGSPVPVNQAAAWWLAFDAINMIDTELANVDAFLSAEQNRPRFAARGVVGAHNTTAFAHCVPTEGWLPLNAHPQISDVAALIDKLGGRELYGNDPSVALRELLQNSSDAIRAMQAIRDGILATDRIQVSLTSSPGHLRITDSGVGMSVETISEVLLNFGVSGWRADRVRRDLPDLLRTKFKASGKYGIGFFSVFMLGQRVRLLTRRFDAAARDTIALEFANGLWERPLLREADVSERILTPGTRIEIDLDPGVYNALLSPIAADPRFAEEPLKKLVQLLAPGSGIPIELDLDGVIDVVLDGRPVADLTEQEFRERIQLPIDKTWKPRPMVLPPSSNIIAPSGEWLGRASLATWHHSIGTSEAGIVISDGGIRGGLLENIIGIVRGESLRASRDVARPVGDIRGYSAWATEQAIQVSKLNLPGRAQSYSALTVISLGGDPGPLALVESRGGFLNKAALRDWIQKHSRIVFVGDSTIDGLRNDRYYAHAVILDEDVLAASASAHFFVMNVQSGALDLWPFDKQPESMVNYVIRQAADVWAVPITRLRMLGNPIGYYSELKAPVGLFDDGTEIVEAVAIIDSPSAGCDT